MYKKTRVRKRIDKKAVFCFLLGLILSVSISTVSTITILPKFLIADNSSDDEKIPEATRKLVKDSVRSSMGEYIDTNKVQLQDESVNEITDYILNRISDQITLSESNLEEIRSILITSIQNTEEAESEYETDQVTPTSNTTTQNSGLSDALKDYIDKEVVPSIVASIEMNSDNILVVNDKIDTLGNNYNEYRENMDAELASIKENLSSYSSGTETNITIMTEELEELCSNYNTFISQTDNGIKSIEELLDSRITISEFESFQNSYDLYKNEVGSTISSLEEVLNTIDITKADQSTVTTLNENFNSLLNDYNTFVSANGEFAALSDRVKAAETSNQKNQTDIAELEEKIKQLEQQISEGNQNSQTAITALEEKFAKFYPVDSVYITFGDENPSDLFGGTWEKIEDTFLMAAGSNYPVGSSGGSNTVTLTAENIPSLFITGNTAGQNGITTSADGAYSGNITSTGTYLGGTYTTTTDGEHKHIFYYSPVEVVRGSGINVFGTIKAGQSTSSSGAHNHTVTIPNQTITTSGDLSIGNHSHTVNIPSLALTGNYTNSNLQSINVTNRYVTVNVWKRVA